MNIICTDFQKIFDFIDYKTIELFKPGKIGLNSEYLFFLSLYIGKQNLVYSVRWLSFCRFHCYISSVLQGSHLEPLLLFVFIDDMMLQMFTNDYLIFT